MPLSDDKLSLHKSLVTRYRRQCAMTLRGRILDCGGGVGNYLPYLSGEVVVFDKSADALDILDHPLKVQGDGEAMPFPDDSFDSVWACAVLQYLHLDKFMQEAIRVTKDGGHIWVLTPNGKSPWDRIKSLLGMDTWKAQEGIVKQYAVEDLLRYGEVTGEIRFLPFERLFRRCPGIGHTLMLHAVVHKRTSKT